MMIVSSTQYAADLAACISVEMNFRVSTAPHSLSKYLNDAGMTSNVKRS